MLKVPAVDKRFALLKRSYKGSVAARQIPMSRSYRSVCLRPTRFAAFVAPLSRLMGLQVPDHSPVRMADTRVRQPQTFASISLSTSSHSSANDLQGSLRHSDIDRSGSRCVRPDAITALDVYIDLWSTSDENTIRRGLEH